jgi:hypothetical protein
MSLLVVGVDFCGVRPYTINIAAPSKPTRKSQGVEETATYLSSKDAPRMGMISAIGSRFESLIEGVALESPRYYFAANPFPPKKGYWHLQVPHDVSLGCNADRAHRAGTTGRGINVVMVDSGHFAHPFFSARG